MNSKGCEIDLTGVSMSIALQYFGGKHATNRMHPLIRKTPFTRAEVYTFTPTDSYVYLPADPVNWLEEPEEVGYMDENETNYQGSFFSTLPFLDPT